MKEITHQGNLIKDFEGIKQAAFSHFHDLFSAPLEEPLDPSAHPLSLIPNLVQCPDNDLLAAPVSMNELKYALSYMKPNSAPSPDGFTASFFLHAGI